MTSTLLFTFYDLSDNTYTLPVSYTHLISFLKRILIGLFIGKRRNVAGHWKFLRSRQPVIKLLCRKIHPLQIPLAIDGDWYRKQDVYKRQRQYDLPYRSWQSSK